jgi:aspartate/methionine/tyrosine aminotransferase
MLSNLIRHCQQQNVLLVMDSVFEDLAWGHEMSPPILVFAQTSRYLATVHSPSKDRPFACGYRVGYVLADASLERWLHQAEAITKNSCNTQSLVWLAFDCLLRLAVLRNGLTIDDCKLLEHRYLCGYGAPVLGAEQIYERISESGLFVQYVERLAAFRSTVHAQLKAIYDWLFSSQCFEPLGLPLFGNILMARVRCEYAAGDEINFFLDALLFAQVTSTVGGAFGISASEGIWIRIAAGGAPIASILDALSHLESYLCRRRFLPMTP